MHVQSPSPTVPVRLLSVIALTLVIAPVAPSPVRAENLPGCDWLAPVEPDEVQGSTWLGTVTQREDRGHSVTIAVEKVYATAKGVTFPNGGELAPGGEISLDYGCRPGVYGFRLHDRFLVSVGAFVSPGTPFLDRTVVWHVDGTDVVLVKDTPRHNRYDAALTAVRTVDGALALVAPDAVPDTSAIGAGTAIRARDGDARVLIFIALWALATSFVAWALRLRSVSRPRA